MGNKKLSDRQIEKMIAERAEGASYRSLGKKYKISENTAKKYCQSKPEFADKCEEEKRAREKDILSHMGKRTGEVCNLIDGILTELSDPRRLKESGTKELAMAFGVIVDKFTALKDGGAKEITVTFSEETKKYAN